MSHKKFGPDRFSRFDVYWIQTDRQTDKPNLYIDKKRLPVSSLVLLSIESLWNTNICSIPMEIIFAHAHWFMVFCYTLREWNITSTNKKFKFLLLIQKMEVIKLIFILLPDDFWSFTRILTF